MTRKRISSESAKMKRWKKSYKRAKDAIEPTECARCGQGGRGWTSEGGDFEPHHPYRRAERWRMLCFIPLCPGCHEEVEHASGAAREDGWIIKPAQIDIFGNPKPRQ